MINTPHAQLPTKYGPALIYGFPQDHKEHCAIVFGDVTGGENILCRIHSSCITGDVFHSLKCDCGEQLAYAFEKISQTGGVILYLDQEWRDIGLMNKIKAYALQDQWYDTVEANTMLWLPVDNREYSIVPMMLDALQISSIRLMTNNPEKIKQAESFWIQVTERVHMCIPTNPHNAGYLSTKQEKMDHHA